MSKIATQVNSKLSIGSIDDFLGPAEDRFFGGAFRGVGHWIQDIELGVDENDKGYVRGRASVSYPTDWSKKDGGVPPPHLSSIDAVLFAAQFAEIYLTRVFRLSDEQRQRMWLRRVDMKPGAKPQDDLVGIAMDVRHVASGPSESPQGTVSAFDCRIGTIKLRCEVEHETGDQAVPEGSFPTAEDVLGDAGARHYGAGYKSREHTIENVLLDLDKLRADATVRVSQWRDGGSAAGIEAAYQPSFSMVDTVLILGQLGQVLLYKQDDLDRGMTKTLWLRRMIIERTEPRRSADSCATSAVVTKSQLLKLGGSLWRSCDLAGEFGGIKAHYRLAHELPERDEGEPA